MNDHLIKVILDMVMEFEKEYRKKISAQLGDLHWGLRTMPAEEHAQWFEQMVAQNPNWAPHLPFIEGGMDEVYRYERTRGLRPQQPMGMM